MSITWRNAGNVFAAGFHDIIVAARAIAAFSNKIQPEAATIETVTAFIPVYGPEAAVIERLAFAALGEFAALVLMSGGANQAAAKMPDTDPQLLKAVEDMLEKNPQLVKQVADQFGIKKNA